MGTLIPTAVRPASVPDGANLDHPSLYFNQELGWLDFNWRVLYQARDPALPLMERVRFLAITASNLDEFVQKRVGGLRRQEAAGVSRASPDGRRPSEQLGLVQEEARRMQSEIDRVWTAELRPRLQEEVGIRLLSFEELGSEEREAMTVLFREQVYPILTPLAVDPGHPFPFISNLSLSLAVLMRHPERQTVHFARVKIPTSGSRWIRVGSTRDTRDFVPIEELVRHHVADLFGAMEIVGAYLFRVTRNADIRRDEEEAEDLLAMISDELRERRFAPVVRLEVERGMPEHVRGLLLQELELPPEDLLDVEGTLALEHLTDLADLEVPGEHQFEPWEPVVPLRLTHEGESEDEEDIFSIIRKGDVLVHHPYESFGESVQRLVEEAAVDPDVLAIKQTLYRTSDDSPIVRALQRAAGRGKVVAVLVEVKARFDEQNNMEWARVLENSGVHVTYGVVGLKTHAKVLLVVRREEGRPKVYCHIGTGNYHARNARVYTDLGLLTCHQEIGADVVDLFHYLTGHAPDQSYRRLIVAPSHMRCRFEELIQREIRNAEEGRRARIVAKMNALDDPGIIRLLYRASRAGVTVDLVVRGHCRLRPGLPGYSEHIRVVSLIGRFLEHDRVFLFQNEGNPEVFIGSADWRTRNLNERVEAIVPILEPELRVRMIDLLESALEDNQLAWELGPDGRYTRLRPGPNDPPRNLHARLMAETRARREGTTGLVGVV
ncbi:MAG: polyphosphate kinase 1 [Gemmatimonadota bacterium]